MNKKNIISASKGIASKLMVFDKKRRSIRRKFTKVEKKLDIKVGKLATDAKKNKGITAKLNVAEKSIRILGRKREKIRRKLTVAEKEISSKTKKFATIIKKTEGARKNLVVKAENLVKMANKKESVRKNLVVTAKEKEAIRKKLVLTAEKLARAAVEKEITRKKLVVTAEELARTTKEIDKAKTEFVSLAAHQLKTPPTAIKWLTEILLDESGEKLTEKQRGFITDLRNEGEQMLKLVNSFLNVSRIDLGNFSVTPTRVDIIALARGVVEELKFEISANSLHLKQKYLKSKLVASTDAGLFRMVIQNLLTNAIHYTSDRGEIKIEVSSKSKGQKFGGRALVNNSITLMVADNGCGIPKKQQSKIFTKLFRADNAMAKFSGGSGLGLYIVKSILGNLGGDVWFTSKENVGSTFYAIIPLSGIKAKVGEKKLT
ncbi:MAG: ATP-binding protein [Patescibacteria group bacterium]